MVSFELFIYILPLLISTELGIVLIYFVTRNRLTPSSIALVVLILGACVWSFGYMLEFLSQTLGAKLFWAKFQYLGIATVPLAWFIFSVRHLGSPGWLRLPLKYRALLGILPVITVGLAWTNELHGLIWQNVHLQTEDSITILAVDHGPGFWAYLAYSYILLFVGTAKLASGLLGSIRLQRWQIRLALLSSLIPWAGNLVYISGLNPIPHLDWTPFSFTIAGLFLTISLFRYQLIQILPIAEKTVFGGLPDCLLVLDAQDCIIDLNQAAQKMLPNYHRVPFGRHLGEVLPDLADWVLQAPAGEEFQIEITTGGQPDEHFYTLRVIPLFGPYDYPVGRLVVCHEITQQKQEQAQLEQVVAERTGELRRVVTQLRSLTNRLQEVQEIERRQIASELHDRIGQNLTALNLNLQIVQNQLDLECAPELKHRLDDSLKLVEETTRQTRDVMADLHPPVLDEFGLVSALNWYGGVFSQRSGIETRVIGEALEPRLPRHREIVLFRLVQEALHNVAKHAQASRVVVQIESSEEEILLTVKDDGQGFDPQSLEIPSSRPHWGVTNMQQRAESIGAQLSIDASPGQGTRICVAMRRPDHED